MSSTPSTLVTGANAFVAAHIIDNLVKRGHKVTGVVRRAAVGAAVLDLHPEWKNSLEIAVIASYESQSDWEDLFKTRSFDYIVHVAAPLLSGKDYDKDFFDPAVKMNISILNAAHAHLPNLKSIAITGSINAATTGADDALRAIYASEDPADRVISSRTWLPISQEEARAMNHYFISYCSAKKESELAVWDFVKKNNPSFGVTVFLSALIFGPPIQPLGKGGVLGGGLNFSIGQLYNLFDGKTETAAATVFPSWIDVRDLAEAHVKALTTESVWGKRLTIGGMPLHFADVVRIVEGLKSSGKIPALEGRMIAKENPEDASREKAIIDASEGNEKLGMTFRTLEETMEDVVRKVLELEAQS